MIKKAALVFIGIFLCGSLLYAQPNMREGNGMQFGNRRSEMTKEKETYFKELEKLINKYNKASEKKKAAVKEEIKELISKETEKDLTESKERVSKLQRKIDEIENDKESYVNKNVEDSLSLEGQKRIKKINSKAEEPDRNNNQNRMGGGRPPRMM